MNAALAQAHTAPESFSRAQRLSCSHGGLFGRERARLPAPPMLMVDRISAIDAHGDYALDRKELDFKAKLFPFQESGNLIKTVVGAVLTPISNVFEVKLTGSLEKPEWAFVIGPTNFLRSLAPENAEPAPPNGAASPTPPPETPAEATPPPAAVPPVGPPPAAR